MRAKAALPLVGLAGAGVAVAGSHSAALDAAAHTWPPFVLVIGLLLIGYVANADGLFDEVARLISRLPGGEVRLYLGAMAVVAIVTVFLNLDTSVAFLTPVLVLVARRRRAAEASFLYGCVFVSNAASLLLPGSNLTNLLVLATERVSGSVYLGRMLLPWAVAVIVTAVGVAFLFRDRSAVPYVDPQPRARSPWLSGVVVLVAAYLVLVLTESALPVLGLALSLVAGRIAQGRVRARDVATEVDLVTITGVFLLAVALGTLARTWSLPSEVMAHAGSIETAALAALASVMVNNLPAAVLLGSRAPAHPRSLLIGLDIGPNLAVTGSLSALIWWRAARSVGARPSVLRYSMAGLVLAPAGMAAALLGLSLMSRVSQ